MNAKLQSVWAAQIVDAWLQLGVRDAVLSPGSRNTPLVLALEAFAREGRVTLHTLLDERAAGFYALGLARIRSQGVLLSCTSGSAGAHYLPAVVEADASAIPLIIATADRPPELHGVGAPQTTNQSALLTGYVRSFADPGAPQARLSPRWVRSLASRLYDAATGVNPGPVHINLPFAKPLWDGEPATFEPITTIAQTYREPARLSDSAHAILKEALETSKRGVILAGPIELGPTAQPRSDALIRLREAVRDLAEQRDLAIIAEPCSNLRLGGHSATVSHGELLVRNHELKSRLKPDLIIQLGAYPTSRGLQRWLRTSGAEVIQIDPWGRWRDPDHVTSGVVAADPASALRALHATLESKPEKARGWAQQWRELDDGVRRLVEDDSGERDLWSGRAARVLCEALPANACLHTASSLAVRVVETYGGALRSDVEVTSNRGVNGIDGTIATWMGQSEALGERPSICVLGDLALLHDASTLLLRASTLVSKSPRVLVVLDNGGGGIFDHLPTAQHPSAHVPLFITPPSCDIAALCATATDNVVIASDAAHLRSALAEALERGGLSIVIARFDREADLNRHRSLDNDVASWSKLEAG